MRTLRTTAPWVLLGLACAAPVLASSMETEKQRRADGLAIRSQIKAWDEALVAGEFAAMASLFSDDFFESEGVPRELYVKMYEQADATYSESDRDNLQIRFYGDTAIVTGQWTTRGNNGQFGSFSSISRMTDIWVKQKGEWKCVATIPSKVRQAFAKIGQVRLGPDVVSEIVILFRVGVSEEAIGRFKERHLSEKSEPHVAIGSYSRPGSVEGHAVVAVDLGSEVSEIEREFLIERLLEDPIVFRVFEDIAPADITLGE